MSWDDGNPYVEELAEGVYAYVQPDGGWMVNNCGMVVDARGTAVMVDTTSTEKRNRAVLAEVAKVSQGAPRAVVNTHHHPDHTYGNGFLPARDRHHRARQVPGVGPGGRPRGDQGHHRAGLRRPRAACRRT